MNKFTRLGGGSYERYLLVFIKEKRQRVVRMKRTFVRDWVILWIYYFVIVKVLGCLNKIVIISFLDVFLFAVFF